MFSTFIQLLSIPTLIAQPKDSLPANPGRTPRLSGFVDVRGVYTSDSEGTNKFSIGQTELDLEQVISDRVGVFLAAAYNSESGAIELGAAELHLTLRNDSLRFLNDISLIAGQFDVPFGIGCRYYASPDCESVTSPWYSHSVGNWSGWNDYGLRLAVTLPVATADLFLVNGYEESAEIAYQVFNLATGLAEESLEVIVTTPEAAIGGRIGIIPRNELMEFGFSAGVGVNDRGKAAMTLFGGDLTYDASRLGCRSEFIYSSLDRNGQTEVSRSFYFQSHYHIAGWRVISRYAAVRGWECKWESQYSAGLALMVAPKTEIRGEVIRTPNDEVVGMLQIVAGF